MHNNQTTCRNQITRNNSPIKQCDDQHDAQHKNTQHPPQYPETHATQQTQDTHEREKGTRNIKTHQTLYHTQHITRNAQHTTHNTSHATLERQHNTQGA